MFRSVERIVGPKATGETCHIIIETNGDIPFWEGQSYVSSPRYVYMFQGPRGFIIHMTKH